MTYADGIKKAYIDGKMVGTQTGITGDLVTSFTRRLGRLGADPMYYANGDIDDVKFYEIALSENQMVQQYDTDNTLQHYYDFKTYHWSPLM